MLLTTSLSRYLLLGICLLFYHASQSQSLRASALNPNVYRTRVNLEAVRIMGKDLQKYDEKVLIDVENKFLDYKIISEDESGYVIIRVLPKVKLVESIDADGNKILVLKRESGKQTKSQADNAYRYYYAIKEDDIPPMGKTLLSEKIVGVPLVHPFKLRAKKGNEGWDIQQEFTVSYSFGIRLKSKKNPFSSSYWTIIPFGFGLGEDKYFKNSGDEKEDAISITYYQGGILRSWRSIHFGAFISFDAMIDKHNDWFYQGRPWYSFGIGYKFEKD